MPRALLTLLALLILPPAAALAQPLEIHFLDVGQGDAVLIRAPTGQNVLYDGGRDADRVLAHLRRLGVERLDLVIASHADADHIGGLPEVVRAYRPGFFLDNAIPHATRVYDRLLGELEAAGSTALSPARRRITLGDVTLDILPPPLDADLGQNANSVGALVAYGEFRAALTGDADASTFRYWARAVPDLMREVEVYKAAHHGSENGDTPLAMQRFDPEVVVVGAGAGNAYGPPHARALRLYAAAGARVYRTDELGSVTVAARPDGTYEVLATGGAPAPGAPPPAAARPAATAGAPPRFDPRGPDRDCGDFRTHAEAQAFFLAAGGPPRDPHRLDGDGNGLACEGLP